MSLFSELRRRNIFRAATFYAAAAWLLVQVASQVFPFFGIEVAIVRWLVLALAIAFVPAMLFSWFYEWTPEGIKRESEVEPQASITLETGRKLDFWIIGALSLIVVLLLVDAFMPHAEVEDVPEKSIAVLPLSNESGGDEELYFSDGLSEDLIIALSQSSELKVIARNSSFRFRGSKEDSRSVGDKLGAAYLLEGSVRRAGGQVRVIVELIKASDGTTLWSQNFERPYKDLFALQDDITAAVAAALQARLRTSDDGGSAGVMQSDRPPSGNLSAYNAYLQGKFHQQRRSEVDYRRAIDFYASATRLDPNYALAHAELAYVWSELAAYYLDGTAARQAYAQARTAVTTALRLDPDLAAAHGARGWLALNADMDLLAAEAEFRRQLQLAPNDSEAQSDLGNLLAGIGQVTQAIELTQRSIMTDPLHSSGYTALAAFLSSQGRLDEAEQAIRTAIELQPEAGWERVQLAIIQIQRGDAAAAVAAAAEVHEEGGWRDVAQAFVQQIAGDPVAADKALDRLIETQADLSAFQIAQVQALRKDPDKVFEWLDRAWANRDPGINRLWFDPFILRYRQDPRFAEFCRKAGLPVSSDDVSGGTATASP